VKLIQGLVLLLGTALISGYAPAHSTEPQKIEVVAKRFAFEPAELMIARGDTVVWSNTDFVPHSATARDSAWDSKDIAANATWRDVPGKAGRYEYYCVLHPTMKGTIVVR